MGKFLKIGPFPVREGASDPKKLRIVMAIWIRKAQNNGSIGCPPEQKAAGAALGRQACLVSDVPKPAELYRFFEGSNWAVAVGAELL